jgi:hypothetical protein
LSFFFFSFFSFLLQINIKINCKFCSCSFQYFQGSISSVSISYLHVATMTLHASKQFQV